MSQTATKPIKIPGPDHPIVIVRHPLRVVVSVAGRKLAETNAALSLREANYPAVFYIPRKDVDMSLLNRTQHASYCPYKGDASYFSIAAAGKEGENAVWSYETPYDSVAAIREHLAFYPDRVKIEEEA